MPDKRHLFGASLSRFGIKQVSSTNERILFPPVAVHSVDSGRLLLTVDRDSLVQALLRGAEPALVRICLGLLGTARLTSPETFEI